MPARRNALALLLVLGGLALAAFYVALLAIADCSVECVERGERLVPVGLIALGLGAATAGALLARLDTPRAAGWGLSVAGTAGALGSAWQMAQGAGATAMWAFGLSFVAILVGSVLRRKEKAP